MTARSIEIKTGCHTLDLRYLLANLRPEDVEELGHTGFDKRAIEAVCAASQSVHLATYRGSPAFVFGLYRTNHVGHIWGFGTKDTKRVMPSITRFVHHDYFPYLFGQTGLKRIEVRVPITSMHSINWLLHLGARIECVTQDHLPSGVPAFQLAYTTREFQRDYSECAIQLQPGL